MSDTDLERPSTASLLSGLLSKAFDLVGAEVRLFGIEITEKVSAAIKAAVAFVVAAVFLIVALVILLQGAVALIVRLGLSTSTANFAVGGGIAIVAAVAIAIALRSLEPAKLQPARSIRQIQDDAAMLKEVP